VCCIDRSDCGALPGTPHTSFPEPTVAVMREIPRDIYNFAAVCFLLSGLIMGVLLAGNLRISVALFVALLVGGSTGFYLSRPPK
jgi:hypothetical protein